MNSFIILPLKLKIRKCPSYFSGFFISPEWHLKAGQIGTVIKVLPHTLKAPLLLLQLKQAGKKTSVERFNDQNLSTGKVIIDLVDACKPGSVRYENVTEGATDQVQLT